MDNNPKNRERAEKMLTLVARAQEIAMEKLIEKMQGGTATAADFKIAMDAAADAGLVLDPDRFPKSLKDKLTSKFDPKAIAEGDADYEAGNRSVQ